MASELLLPEFLPHFSAVLDDLLVGHAAYTIVLLPGKPPQGGNGVANLRANRRLADRRRGGQKKGNVKEACVTPLDNWYLKI